jgi:hypothetical protein
VQAVPYRAWCRLELQRRAAELVAGPGGAALEEALRGAGCWELLWRGGRVGPPGLSIPPQLEAAPEQGLPPPQCRAPPPGPCMPDSPKWPLWPLLRRCPAPAPPRPSRYLADRLPRLLQDAGILLILLGLLLGLLIFLGLLLTRLLG